MGFDKDDDVELTNGDMEARRIWQSALDYATYDDESLIEAVLNGVAATPSDSDSHASLARWIVARLAK